MIEKRSHGAIVVEAIQPCGSGRMSRDIFADVRGLVALLLREGLKAEAHALSDAVESGSTGTEILMALRWHLRQIVASAELRTPVLRQLVRELEEDVGAALGS